MGITNSRENVDDNDAVQCGISEFEHTFAASLEDFSPGAVPDPLPGNAPSTSRSRSGGKSMWETSCEPLSGRLVTVHMLGTELIVREAVGLKDRELASIPFAAIRQLTWDHSQSSLKVGYGPTISEVENKEENTIVDPDSNYISVRVENSLELEDELKHRGMAEARRAAAAGLGRPPLPASIYLGVFAGNTKPKPFQRKRPNLSSTIPEGYLPSLQDMRRWSIEGHWGSARPQEYSNRPRLAMDAVFTGGNYFPLTSVTGLTSAAPDARVSCKAKLGGFVLTFTTLGVQLPECDESASFALHDIDDWSVIDSVGKETEAESGFELWILTFARDPGPSKSKNDEDSKGPDSPCDDGHSRCRRVFLGIPDQSLGTARNSMEFFWNMSRAARQLPPMAGSTHGRQVASITTLRGEEKAPAPPAGRVDPINLDGVEVRVGQVIQCPKNTGQVQLMPSPRALLGVEKKKTFRYNARTRQHWDRVVLHQGWLKKRGGGAIKRWIWRYFVLYDTPQGHYLAYYNDVSDIPLFCDTGKERQLVDMCQVCYLRPEIKPSKQQSASVPPHAFTVVTIERHWTLCAESQASVLQWVRMLSVAIDEDVAVTDDGQAIFGVRARWAPTSGRYGSEMAATAFIGSMGMELRFDSVDPGLLLSRIPASTIRGGIDSENVVTGEDGCRSKFWSYTDFYKWTITKLKDGTKGLAIQCFRDDQFLEQEEILLATPKSHQLALVIEHQVEKFMSVMHLRLELWPDMAVSDDPLATGTDATTKASERTQEEKSSTPDEQSEDTSEGAANLSRVSLMNLEMDQTAWGNFGGTIPGIPELAASPAGGNPFQSDRSDDNPSDEIPIDTCPAGGSGDGTDLLYGPMPSTDDDPFDPAPPHEPENVNKKDPRQVMDASWTDPDTFETANLTPSAASRGPQKFFGDITSYAHPDGASARTIGSGTDVISPSPFSPSAAWSSRIPVNASQSRAVGSEDSTGANASSLDAVPEVARDGKSASLAKSNPFASPESAKSLSTASTDSGAASKPGGKRFNTDQIIGNDEPTVIHKDDIMIVTLEGIARKDWSRVLTIDYELPCVTGGAFSVELINDDTSPAILSAITPAIVSAPLDGESGATARFRQDVVMTCARPFKVSPGLRLIRSAPSQRPSLRRPSVMIMTVSLPVTIASFLSGRSMGAEAFGMEWKNLNTPDQVAQETVTLNEIADADAHSSGEERAERDCINASGVRRALIERLGFVEVGLSLQGAAEETQLIAATGVLQTASVLGGVDGPPIECLIGVEVEKKAGTAKIVAKSRSRDLAASVVNVVVEAMRQRGGVIV